jgi:D-beta-D-heptose 7-phosphate kinase / D-beta-D-heptose 1-phosphate adenosyltransferase
MNDIYIRALSSFSKLRILVIGELMLDVYLKGRSTRLSPEAPVPVVDVEEREASLGGAANTVCNFKALGARVDFISVVGEDESGQEAIALLHAHDVSSENIFIEPSRSTIVKTRVISSGHIVTRFDQGSADVIQKDLSENICSRIRLVYRDYDAVVLSDYCKGIIDDELISVLSVLRSDGLKFLAVDSKRLPFFRGVHADLVKPNYDEATAILKTSPLLNGRARQIMTSCEQLLEELNSNMIAVTLDSDGSVIANRIGDTIHVKAPDVLSPHVAGAGDTYLAAFLLTFLSTKDMKASAELASAAAAIVIRKESTSTCSVHELEDYFKPRKMISSFEELEHVCEKYRSAGKKIAFTNGCFDILHSGHVTYLQCARDMGDVLIVGINTDESIKRIKGPLRPVNSLDDRIQVLSGLSCVSHIVAFGNNNDDIPTSLIKIVRPDVFVKGGDYTLDQLPEATCVEENGGRIEFITKVPDRSTTSIIRKIKDKPLMLKEQPHEVLERL